jgi:hypothetical protein
VNRVVLCSSWSPALYMFIGVHGFFSTGVNFESSRPSVNCSLFQMLTSLSMFMNDNSYLYDHIFT